MALMAYVKSGDTVGTIYSDQHFKQMATGIAKQKKSTIQAYPNPVRQTLHITNLAPAQPAELRLFKQMG